VKDRRSPEGLFNFTFQSFLAGKSFSSTNEPGHIRNGLSTAVGPSALVRVTVRQSALMSSATVYL